MMRISQQLTILILGITAAALMLSGCDDIFGSKGDSTTDEIFDTGRLDPTFVPDDVGYASLPFWTDFNQPTDVYVGFDELVYVTDSDGLHVLDRAGRLFQTIPLEGAVAVVQDRMLDVYVAARVDTVLEQYGGITVNLPAVLKIRNANGAGPVQIIDRLVHPFSDASRPPGVNNRRLDVNSSLYDPETSDTNVEITGLTVLADNTLYVTRRGPLNPITDPQAPDNTILEYTLRDDGSGTMRNVRQIRQLNPNTPSLVSAVGPGDIQSFIGPPQRENISSNRNFLVSQTRQDVSVPYRVLWVEVRETDDGIQYAPNSSLLGQDTTRADGFLYEVGKFENPSGISYAPDGTGYIFVTDSAKDSLFVFQSNGREGVPPPPGSEETRDINVSFGGTGLAEREFNEPSGVAYFRRIVYVADKNNNRISRFILNTDLER